MALGLIGLAALALLPPGGETEAALLSKLKVISLTSDLVIEGKSCKSLLPKSLMGYSLAFSSILKSRSLGVGMYLGLILPSLKALRFSIPY